MNEIEQLRSDLEHANRVIESLKSALVAATEDQSVAADSGGPRMVTIAEAAISQHVTPQTIRNWISSGYIKAERRGPRLIWVDMESVRNAVSAL